MTFKSGFDAESGPSRKIMRFLGIYPDPENKFNNITRFHFLIPAFVMLFFCNYSQSYRIVNVWGDLNEVLDVLTGSDIPIGVSCFKLCALRYYTKLLNDLVLSMSNDWKIPRSKDEQDVMWKYAKLGRRMSIAQISLSGSTISAYFIGGCFVLFSEYKQWLQGANITRSLYLKSDFFFEAEDSPVFEITWVMQVWSAIFAATSFSSVDAFFAVLVLHLCGQLKILQDHMKRLTMSTIDSSNVDSYTVVLADLVTRYEYLENFGKNIEEAFNATFLVQMIVASVVLCLQGYQLVVLTNAEGGIPLFDFIFMIYFTMLFLFSIFIYCYVVEVLRTESTEVGEAAYQIEWYNLPVHQAKPLIIIMIRAKQPFKITAGKFTELSLELYCSILKTSASYLSMLLAVRDRLAE